MAFSFGAAAPSAFGASAPTPTFGAPAATPTFGAPAQTPAFGAAPSTAPSMFGTTSAPGFGAAQTGQATSAFGSQQPAAPTSAPSLFGASPAPSLFGQQPAAGAPRPGGLFGATQAPATQSLVMFQPQQQQQQQQQSRLNYKTKFEELPPNIQQDLQRIQQQISLYRDECKALNNDPRLQDASAMTQGVDAEAAALGQSLQSLYQSVNADDEAMLAFREKVIALLRSTESAVRLYQRSKAWRELSQAGPNQIMSQALQDQLAQPVQLPNPFLQLAVQSFQEALDQYHSCVTELERMLPQTLSPPAMDDAATLQSLPCVISHMHDYFVHVAARLEKLHQGVSRLRDSYLAQRRAMGDYSDPFEDARPLHHLSTGLRKPVRLGASAGGGAASDASSSFALVAAGAGSSGAAGMSPSHPASSSAFGAGGLLSPGGMFGAGSPFGAAGVANSADKRSNSGRPSSSKKR